MRPHPEGVLPVGNAYLLPPEEAAASARAKRDGLGSFAALDDALIIRLLSGGDDDDGVGPDALASLAACSRAMRAFAYHEDLWKAATLIAKGGDFRFTGGTWRDTYRYTRGGGGGDPGSSDDKAKVDAPKSPPPVFSDALYFRHLGAHLPLDPEWLERDTLPRVDASAMTPHRFIQDFESINRPVVVTGLCADWPSTRGEWRRDALLANHGDTKFTVGGYEMSLTDFYTYGDGARDDLPLYLFDKNFCEKAPQLSTQYKTPDIFADDLFALLGETQRPDYRWLIAGCERSGSSFHKDPNATSAWNAVVYGRKKWILFRPDTPPPGVHPSADGSSVVQPVTLVEWYMNFYQHVYEDEEDVESETDDEEETGSGRKRRREGVNVPREKSDGSPRVMEGICGPGDVLFVPSGWWHMALNLEECVAVTQNFCSPRTLPKVLRFLKDASTAEGPLAAELVSGTCRTQRGDLYERFVGVLSEKRPEELTMAERYLVPGAKIPARYSGAAGEAAVNASTNESAPEKKRKASSGGPVAGLSDAFKSSEGASFSFNFS